MRQVNLRERLPSDVTWMASSGMVYIAVLIVDKYGLWVDSHAYWNAWQGSMYAGGPASVGAYLYSPAFAQILWPLAQLPWPILGAVFAAFTTAALAWLFRPLGWKWAAPLTLCCSSEILVGNIYWLFAMVVVLGSRWPYLWALPALTKVTPNLGPLWFAVRGEWIPLIKSLGATLALAGVSYSIAPSLWADWLQLLVSNRELFGQRLGGVLLPPAIYRIPVALLLVAWGARTDRRWSLPVGMILASPVFSINSVALLAALPRFSSTRSAEPRDVIA